MNTVKPCEKLCLCTCLVAAVIRSPKGEAGVTAKVILIKYNVKLVLSTDVSWGRGGSFVGVGAYMSRSCLRWYHPILASPVFA